MKRKSIGVIVAATLAVSLLGAPNASAATEIGSNCVGNTASPNLTLTHLSSAPGDLPDTVPAGGVITQWKVSVIPFPGSIPEQLKVLRGSGTTFQTVAESSLGTVIGGSNTFAARIPVQAGDHIGVYSGIETIYCVTGDPLNVMGVFEGNATVGSTNPYEAGAEFQPAVSATIEPDADGDGYGDETQDQCPQSASTQAPCPLAVLSASAVVRKGLATILITSNVQTPVTVAGKVKLGKGKKVNLNGGTQVVNPGTIAKFTILFPARLKEALRSLSSKQFLTLALTATAPNIAGAPTVKKVNAKAKGQKKPARKGKRGKGKAKKG